MGDVWGCQLVLLCTSFGVTTGPLGSSAVKVLLCGWEAEVCMLASSLVFSVLQHDLLTLLASVAQQFLHYSSRSHFRFHFSSKHIAYLSFSCLLPLWMVHVTLVLSYPEAFRVICINMHQLFSSGHLFTSMFIIQEIFICLTKIPFGGMAWRDGRCVSCIQITWSFVSVVYACLLLLDKKRYVC